MGSAVTYFYAHSLSKSWSAKRLENSYLMSAIISFLWEARIIKDVKCS